MCWCVSVSGSMHRLAERGPGRPTSEAWQGQKSDSFVHPLPPASAFGPGRTVWGPRGSSRVRLELEPTFVFLAGPGSLGPSHLVYNMEIFIRQPTSLGCWENNVSKAVITPF